MNYEIIALFLKTHAGGDDKLRINLAWPYTCYHTSLLSKLFSAVLVDFNPESCNENPRIGMHSWTISLSSASCTFSLTF